MSMSRILTGAQVLCYINRQPCGKVIGFSWNAETPRRFIQTIDVLTPYESVALNTQVTGNISLYRLHGDGGAEGLGMAAPNGFQELEKYFSIMIVDVTNDSVVFQADQCSVMSQTWRIERGHVRGDITFRALVWANEVQSPA